MKKAFTSITLLLLALFLIRGLPVSAATKKDISNEIKTKTLSKNTVKIKWKKHSVKKYILYQELYGKDGSLKLKKLKTVSGKKTSTTIKSGKNKFLSLYIKGVNKNKTKIFYGWFDAYTGLSTPYWDDYLGPEGDCSPSFIELEAYSYGGLTPTGYQIYRKDTKDGSYKKIKTIKSKKRHITWKDKSVKAGRAYYYKIRTYKKIKKKTLYSSKSSYILRYSVNFSGKFTVNNTIYGNSLTMVATSDSNNGPTIFSLYSSDLMPVDNSKNCYKLSEYSTDGTNWVTVSTSGIKVPVVPGRSLWLRFVKTTCDYDPDEYTQNMITFDIIYRGAPSFIDLTLENGIRSTYLNSESIH